MARHLQAMDVLSLTPLHMQATHSQVIPDLRLPTTYENISAATHQ